MPFVSEIETDFDSDPFFDNFGTGIIEFALGYDLDVRTVPVMSVMLVPGISHQLGEEYAGAWDIAFGIRERSVDHEWNVTAPDFTIETSKKYIPEEARGTALDCVVLAARYLVRYVNPETITMSTFYAHLPPKGVAKYLLVCDEIFLCGYELEDSFVADDGKRVWFFRRK